jgi:hypothetical protein
MVEPLRHRQTKGAETDMPGLPPPRHIPTLPCRAVREGDHGGIFGRPGTAAPGTGTRRFRTFPPSPLSGEVRPATDLRRDHGVTTGGGTSHITILSEPRIPDKLPHSGQQTPETIAGAGV